MADLPSSTNLINQLKCDVCKNPLSFFPIVVTKDNSICGRCSVKDGGIRITIYETAVAFHEFPCRYKRQGCFANLLPKDVPEHEKRCSFRLGRCPFADCGWKGALSGLISHCGDKHSQLMLQENQDFDIDLSISKRIIKFLIHDNNLLAVSWEFDNQRKKLTCLLTHFREELKEKKYGCELSLKYEERSYSTKFDTESITKISYMELLENHLEVLEIIGSLRFGKSARQMAQSSKEEDQMNMLSFLQCDVCSGYILPPIYTFPNGVVYCTRCCDERPNELPNVTLNNLANLIEYPCKYKRFGCKFAAVPSLIEKHQQEMCQFRIVKCIIGFWCNPCSWEDQFAKVESHIIEEHEFNLNGTTYCFDISEKRSIARELIKFGNYFFELIYISSSSSLYWTVHKIEGVPGNFQYEIELIDTNNTRNRLIVRNSCANFQQVRDYKDVLNCDSLCCIRKTQVCKFVKEEEKEAVNLRFKVYIFNDA